MKKLFFSVLLLFACLSVAAQDGLPVKWSYYAEKTGPNTATIFARATIEKGWHIYSINLRPGGPTKTSMKLKPSADYVPVGSTVGPKPVVYYDKYLKMELGYYEQQATFSQKIKLNKGTAVVKGSIEYAACRNKECLPPDEVSFSIVVK